MNFAAQPKTILSIVSLSLLSACAGGPVERQQLTLTAAEQGAVQQRPAYLQPLYRDLYAEGQRNEVLNRMEIGTAAFYQGDLDIAREQFDAALDMIETVYADNPAAHRARSLWHAEEDKDFKGEPYERAMAYYYRGLIYLIDGDYGNARASFMSGLMQDAFAEEEQHRADFTSLMLLAGWSAERMGQPQLAQEAYSELLSFRPEFPLPEPDHQVLIISETGTSPRKLADGMGHYELVFRRGRNFKEEQVTFMTAQGELPLLTAEDVYFQATTRGGRPIDAIIAGQARFQQATATSGEAFSAIGAGYRTIGGVAGHSGTRQTGNILGLAGVAQQALSTRVQPRADTRYWHRLPDRIHSHTLPAEELTTLGTPSDWQVQYTNGTGEQVTAPRGRFHHWTDPAGYQLIWHSSRPRN